MGGGRISGNAEEATCPSHALCLTTACLPPFPTMLASVADELPAGLDGRMALEWEEEAALARPCMRPGAHGSTLSRVQVGTETHTRATLGAHPTHHHPELGTSLLGWQDSAQPLG